MTASSSSSHYDVPVDDLLGHNPSIEERSFAAVLIILLGHFSQDPPMGPLTMAKVTSMLPKTLDKTQSSKEARENLSKNVAIWIWLTRVFASAIPSLTTRSVGPLSSLNDPEKGVSPQESTALILKNYATLKEDLQYLNKLMLIARNLMVTAESEVPQDLSGAVQFDQMAYQTLTLCVNVTSKGYDGEVPDDASRAKLSEITDLYKKMLVTCLQQIHNWTTKNDRSKMSFWLDMLSEDDPHLDDEPQDTDINLDSLRAELQDWLDVKSKLSDRARALLHEYADANSDPNSDRQPGPLTPIMPLAANWLPSEQIPLGLDVPAGADNAAVLWDEIQIGPSRGSKRRVSPEIDLWWAKARDLNYEKWTTPMPSVEFARTRADTCRGNLITRYAAATEPDDGQHSHDEGNPHEHHDYHHGHHGHLTHHEHSQHDNYSESQAQSAQNAALTEDDGSGSHVHDYVDVDEGLDDEDLEDEDDYGEGPMGGLLTEVPNILDPKQIEALHMIIKSCVVEQPSSVLGPDDENLQDTRCKMFLALPAGKGLLRELLVFIAVWEKDEQTTIFQLTMQIVEAIHRNALLPYAWNSLRIPKDIMSPAQTVLLRLSNYMFRTRNASLPVPGPKEHLRDVKLVHFLFSNFRKLIVPECMAIMYFQAQVRRPVDGDNFFKATDFPVDTWDMERAKDGLAQFLEFFITVSEVPDMRAYLIEWEAVYDLLAILKSLEQAVPPKPLVEIPNRGATAGGDSSASTPVVDDTHASQALLHRQGSADSAPPPPPPPPPPPSQEEAWKFPWENIKIHILTILASLLQPPLGKSSPGNAAVQAQIVRYEGIQALLNCYQYDGNNRFSRERVTLVVKWLMDGSQAAQDYLRNLKPKAPPPSFPPTTADGQPGTVNVRVDGVGGEVKVQARSASAPAASSSTAETVEPGPADSSPAPTFGPPPPPNAVNMLPPILPRMDGVPLAPRTKSEDLLHDILDLADQAAKMAMSQVRGFTEADDPEDDFM